MTQALPDPPLPAVVNLRHFRTMPLDVMRLRDSDIARAKNAEGFRRAVLAWCVSWHQLPAASLPDDDEALADLMKIGSTPRAVKEWQALRPTALRGFVKCNDGRLYHMVVAEMAIDAWHASLNQQWMTECRRLKKQAQRAKQPYIQIDFPLWITRTCPPALPYLSRWKRGDVPRDTGTGSPGQPPGVSGEIGSNGREGMLPTTTSTSTETAGHRPVDNPNPGPDGPTSTPRAHGHRHRGETPLVAEGKRRGIEPRVGESMEAFEERVRTTRAA